MKRIIVIVSLILIVVFSTAFSSSTNNKKKIMNTSCANSSKVEMLLDVTVLSFEESKNTVQVPFLDKSFVGFKDAVGFKESSNRYNIINSLGYLGKYQFGKSTLRRLKIYNTIKFLRNSEQQEKAFKALCSLNKHILRKDIKRSVGRRINGIKITESGILAAAHLGGAGNVKKYLRSGGVKNFSDAYGSSIQYYMRKFSGFDVSSIKATKNPVI